MQLKGSCHCRAVRFTLESDSPVPFMHCHCSICRKTAGSGGYAINLGSAPLVLLSLPAGLAVDWTAVSPAIWVGLLWAVLVAAFIGWIVWGWVNAVRGVARTAPLIDLMPPVAGLVAWIRPGRPTGQWQRRGTTRGGQGCCGRQSGRRAPRQRVLPWRPGHMAQRGRWK